MLKILSKLGRDRGDSVLVTVMICIPLFMMAFMFSVGLAQNAWVKTSFADSAQASAQAAAASLNNSGYLGEQSVGTFVSEYMRLTGRTPGTTAQVAAGGFGTAEGGAFSCRTVEVDGVPQASPYIEIRLDRTRALGVGEQGSPLYVSAGGATPTAVFTLNTRVNYRVISATVYEASTSLLGDGFALLGEDAGCYTSRSNVSGITFGANEDLDNIGGDAACWVPAPPTDIEDTVYKTSGSIKLYSGADFTCPVVGYVSSPYILATGEYGSFFQINFGGSSYWVNSLDVRPPDSCETRVLDDRTSNLSPAVQYSTGANSNVKIYSAPFPDCVTSETISGEVTVVAEYAGAYSDFAQLQDGRWVLLDEISLMRTVVFNANSGVGGGTTRIYDGGSIDSFAPATRLGYTFTGWYTAATGGSQVLFPRVINGNETYFAQWSTRNFSIAWSGGGGNLSGCAPTSYAITSLSIVPSVSTCSSKTRAGYSFSGWSPLGIPTGSTGNRTFTAQWTIINYSIDYVLTGGSGTNCGPTSYNVTSGNITPSCSPVRTNHNFTGWSPASIPTGSTGNRTFTAQWAVVQYTVSFNTRGGSGVAAQTVNHGASVSPGSTPTRAGWTFRGWSTTGVSGTTPNVTFPRTITANATFFAHWTRTTSSTQTANANVTVGQYQCNVFSGAAGSSGSFSNFCARAYINSCPSGFANANSNGSYAAFSNGWTLNWGNWTQPGRHNGPYRNFTGWIVGSHPTCSRTVSTTTND